MMETKKSFRLDGYDYSSPGFYFVTTTIRDFTRVFGRVIDATMCHNDLGRFAIACWEKIPSSYPGLVLHEFVVMPNHMHGIIEITESAYALKLLQISEENKEHAKTEYLLGQAVGSFKSGVTGEYNKQHPGRTGSVWYEGYKDRIIRNDFEYYQKTHYIRNNPLRWHEREQRRKQRKS